MCCRDLNKNLRVDLKLFVKRNMGYLCLCRKRIMCLRWRYFNIIFFSQKKCFLWDGFYVLFTFVLIFVYLCLLFVILFRFCALQNLLTCMLLFGSYVRKMCFARGELSVVLLVVSLNDYLVVAFLFGVWCVLVTWWLKAYGFCCFIY